MAKLRPVTHQALTDPKYIIDSRDIQIKEGEQYEVAERLFNEHPEILYFNYWDDEEGNRMMDYSIDREDVKLRKELPINICNR